MNLNAVVLFYFTNKKSTMICKISFGFEIQLISFRLSDEINFLFSTKIVQN